jgi:tight adherence protein B
VPRTTWLQQAGVDLTPTQFWAVSALAGAVTLAVVAALTRAPLVAIAPALAAAAVPHVWCSHRRSVRLRAWQAAWPDALRELIAAVVAGRSLPHAVTALGDFGPEPLRAVFADFRVLMRVFGFTAALEQVKERLADPTSDRVVEVLIVAHEQGGSIVRDVLEDLVVATTKDLKVLDEIDTEGLEMRINARAVLVLPWAVLVALTLRPGPFRDFYQSTAGVLVVLGAGALSVVGATWLGRLGRQPAEPRVFAASTGDGSEA